MRELRRLHRFMGGVTRSLNISYLKAVPVGKLICFIWHLMGEGVR